MMTPLEVEGRLIGHEGHPDSATVAAVLHELRADPAWVVTEITVNGRLMQVELAHETSGVTYTLRTQPGAGAAGHATPPGGPGG
jgi:hypothetical protein